MCWEIQFYFYVENIWHQFRLDWTERGGWVLPREVTRAWGRATHRLMTTYVTVFPYRYKLLSALQSLSKVCTLPTRCCEPLPWPYAGCWGLTFMCWGCPNRPIRCFCFLCSVIWRAHTQKKKDFKNNSTCWHARLLPAERAGSLSPLSIDSFFHTALQKLTNDAQSLHAAKLKRILFEILASSSTLLRLLTKAREYKLLILILKLKSEEISEIKQSAWVITQVLTFIPAGTQWLLLLRIHFI